MTLNNISTALNQPSDRPAKPKTSRAKQAPKMGKSPTNRKKSGAQKLNAIYKQLCEKVKVLQVTSQKLFDKNQKLKDYEQKCRQELERREQAVLEREKKLNMHEHDQSMKQSLKTEEFFNARNEYSDIMQQLHNLDTRKGPQDVEMFDQNHEDPFMNTKSRMKSPDLFKNYLEEENLGSQMMLKSLEPGDFALGQTRNSAQAQLAETGT